MDTQLPIYIIRKEIQNALVSSNQLILHAPTGSGKSTLVPQFLIDDILNPNETVIVLQPRRLAARLIASYIASVRKGELGQEVGYQVRLEGKHQACTRILFLTEGILLNRLLSGDLLDNVGAVIFDEFHERHLETDISLSLALKLQKQNRPDLRLIVMSATLEIEKVRNVLSNSILLESEGKQYPIDIAYRKSKPTDTLWDFAAYQLEAVLPDFREGSALIFMPGAFEIKKTIEAVQKRTALSQFQLCPLYSALSGYEQDKATRSDGRKIIVSTNVAETSITLPDIRLVIDSGLARISRYDPKRGINTLFVEPISCNSADQRAGRAGRVSAGKCIRLWSAFDHQNKVKSTTPEIHRIDLSEAVLGIIASGYENPYTFPWIEAPDKKGLENAMALLRLFGAIDTKDKITNIGFNMAQLKVHPRYAKIILKAGESDCLSYGAILVALSQAQGFLSRVSDPELKNSQSELFGDNQSDLILELNAWLWAGSNNFNSSECSRMGINAHIARQVGQLAVQILQRTNQAKKYDHKLPGGKLDPEVEEKLRKSILAGFIDFLAVRHRLNSPVCAMLQHKSGQLHRDSCVQNSKFMVVNELEETKSPTGVRILLKKVTAVEPEWLKTLTDLEYQEKVSYRYDTELNRAMQLVEISFQDLVLNREQKDISSDDIAAEVLLESIHTGLISFPHWDDNVEDFVRRANFAAKHAPQYQIPEINEEARDFIMLQTIYKCRSFKDIQKCNIWPNLKSWFSYEQYEAIQLVAPEFINLPHRKRPVKLRYNEKGDVILSETIQALYDCPLPVTVAEGKVKVIFELLAPSRRPVQITSDLEYFWKNSYLEIKKELKGRYPKHEWR